MHSSIFFLCVLCVTTQAVHGLRAPIEDPSLSASGDGFAELTPLVSNPLRSTSDRGDVDRRDNPLAGLLVRQSCPSGRGLCNDGGCCPLGGRCCGGGKCCDPGTFCYGNSCCGNNETGCGGNGCCPVNYTCCPGGGGCCEVGTYCVVVNGRHGCCENGKICTSGGGVVTLTREPTPDPITQTTFPTTRTTATTAQTITATSVVPSPTPAPGSSIVDITATDPRIIYRGGWQSVTSSCNSSSQSRMATEAFSSFSLDFQGDAVYLSLSSNNAWYIVTVGGRTTTFGGFESQVIPSNCSLSFEQAGLPTQSNTIEVLVSGSSLDSSIDDPWSFALDKIVVASTDPADTTSARAAQSTVTGLSDSSAPVVFKWATVGLAAGAAGVSVFFLF